MAFEVPLIAPLDAGRDSLNCDMPVTVLTSQPGKMRGIGSAYDAARFVLEEWPIDVGLKLTTAKQILLKCLAG